MNNHNHYRPYERLREEDLYKCSNCDDLKQQLSDQQALIEKQKKAIEVLKESNDFYKEESDWNFYCNCCATGETKLEMDHGKKAREAKLKVEEILANEN